MSGRFLDFVIDIHQCTEAGMETGILQESSVSSVLFAIYLYEVL